MKKKKINFFKDKPIGLQIVNLVLLLVIVYGTIITVQSLISYIFYSGEAELKDMVKHFLATIMYFVIPLIGITIINNQIE